MYYRYSVMYIHIVIIYIYITSLVYWLLVSYIGLCLSVSLFLSITLRIFLSLNITFMRKNSFSFKQLLNNKAHICIYIIYIHLFSSLSIYNIYLIYWLIVWNKIERTPPDNGEHISVPGILIINILHNISD